MRHSISYNWTESSPISLTLDMTHSQLSRRKFLSTAGRSTAATGAAALLLKTSNLFAQQLEEAPTAIDRIDVSKLRSQYSLGKEVVYLNHASIGAIPIPVQNARAEYLKICESNPWLYTWGGAWDEGREQTRGQIAKLIGCSESEVALTHNTTEFFNTLAHGLPFEPGDEVLFSSLNHSGASVAFEHMADVRKYKVREFEFPMDNVTELTSERVVELYAAQIRPETKLLVFPHIDNTIGLRHPVKQIAAMARKAGVSFVAVDAAQSVGTIDVNVRELGVDAYSTSPHKWLGAPKGLGLAYVSKSLQETLRPMWVTWGQKSWSESARKYEDYGTRNLAEVLALGNAITFHTALDQSLREKRLQEIWQHTKTRAEAHNQTRFNSPAEFPVGSPVISIEVMNADCNQLAKSLFRDHQIVVRPFKIGKQETIRISPNIYTSTAEIDQFFDILEG